MASTIVYSIGDRSERVHGTVIGFTRPDGRGHVLMQTENHGTLAVERAKLDDACWVPFDPNASRMAEAMAMGHLARTGHQLTGLYVYEDNDAAAVQGRSLSDRDTGAIAHLVRTCACGVGDE